MAEVQVLRCAAYLMLCAGGSGKVCSGAEAVLFAETEAVWSFSIGLYKRARPKKL